MSRISTSQIFQLAHTNVASARERETQSAEKAATGKNLSRPSQDPAGWVQAAASKAQLAEGESHLRVASLSRNFLEAAEDTLVQLQEGVQRAYELAIAGASTGGGDRLALAAEARTISQAGSATVNAAFAGRYLFGGTQTARPPFAEDGSFSGNQSPIEAPIARGLRVNVAPPTGKFVLGQPDGDDVLTSLRQLATALENDDVDGVREAIEPLRRSNEQLSLARADIGGRLSLVEGAGDAQAAGSINLQDSISRIEDADVLKVFTDLARDQTVFRAALQSSQRLLSSADASFLK